MDYIPKQDVLTKIRIKNTKFDLYVYAYRKLTKSEMKIAANLWLDSAKLKSFPMEGSGKIIANFGYNGE